MVTWVEMDRKQDDLSRPCTRQAEVGRQGGRLGRQEGRQGGPHRWPAHLQVAVLTPHTHVHVLEDEKDIATPITKQPGETGVDCCVEIRPSKKADGGTSFNSNSKSSHTKLAE